MEYISIIISAAVALILAVWNLFLQSRIKRIEAENQERLEVHKVQFIKEFEIYSELWDTLVQLRRNLGLLRPILDQRPKDKSKDQVDKERMDNAICSANKCIDIFENQKPFYSPVVYQYLNDLSGLVKKEIVEVQLRDPKDRDYHKRGEENMNKVIDLMDKVCIEIRERIGTK